MYAINPSKTWPEVPSHTAVPTKESVVSSSVMALAHWLAGNAIRFDVNGEDVKTALLEMCVEERLDPARVIRWAQSLLLKPEATLEPENMKFVPDYMPYIGFAAKPYQIETAAWSAARMGSILALSCGTGKTFTAYAAATAAARSGRCSDARCYIVCPVNAAGAWKPYIPLLYETFKEVAVVSVDSAHKFAHIERLPGGALIVDECHKTKGSEARRALATYKLRMAFEWCVCLTGTLLHTGPEGVIMMQNIAMPGLARYSNAWDFGKTFDCIVTKVIAGRSRSALVAPPASNKKQFVEYLRRGVKSLSFASKDVREAVNLPEQTVVTVDSWPVPEWVQTLQRKDLEARGVKDVDAAMKANCSHYKWPACMPDNELLAFSAIAMAKESRVFEDDEAKLPHFMKVMYEVAREGRYDRCLKVTEGDAEFVYAPGTSADDPGPGAKIQEILRWVDENPEEAVLIGSASSGGKDAVAKALRARGLRVEIIDGTTSAASRASLVEEFQSGKLSHLVVQQVAGSESITLTRAATSFLIDHAFSPVPYTQFLARLCRTGQTRESQHFDLVFNQLQMLIVERLRRGESFDADVRKSIELHGISYVMSSSNESEPTVSSQDGCQACTQSP